MSLAMSWVPTTKKRRMQMGKKFDALYGEVIEDPLGREPEVEIPDRPDPAKSVAILKSRSEGYHKRAEHYKDEGKNAMAETFRTVSVELAYLAKEFEAGNFDELLAKGE